MAIHPSKRTYKEQLITDEYLTMTRKIWLFSPKMDLLVLNLPVWLCWAICLALPVSILEQDLPMWFWVVFILGIDVSHVWSTIFRTYLDKEEFQNHRQVLIRTPILVFLILFPIAAWSTLWFWRVMAYVALHHFIKQQYGFLALYRAKFGYKPRKILADRWVIYFSMLYPVAYWHLTSQRQFNWFVNGDFFNLNAFTSFSPTFFAWTNAIYWLVLLAWLVEEILYHRQAGLGLAWGKILWLLTTATNWYLGIVYFNSDVAFSLTNVVAHGLPYMALTFYYVQRKKVVLNEDFTLSGGQMLAQVMFMLGIVLLLALGEEYLWDLWLNQERQAFFGTFLSYPMAALDNRWLRAGAFALLSIPQVSHYIIDGHIWRGSKKNPHLKRVLME